MINNRRRTEFTNEVWFEKEKGKWTVTSYCVKTKSKGKKIILLLSNIPDIPTMGITKDDKKFKMATNKV